MISRQVMAIVLAAATLMPLAAAEWGGRGFYEPDTAEDRSRGAMWADSDKNVSGPQMVYFSTYPQQGYTSANPNSGILGTQITAVPSGFNAHLGVWKDCNADGYIGLYETALEEYPAALLDTAGVARCPSVGGNPYAPGFRPSHNDGQWVREFLWIGPDYMLFSNCHPRDVQDGKCFRKENNTNPYNLPDETARVWGDWGLPLEVAVATCPVNPIPRGTLQSTGGALRYTDCIGRWLVTSSITLAANETNNPGLGFGDADSKRPDESASPLNQPNPWGRPRDDEYYTVFDCTDSGTPVTVGGRTYRVRNLTLSTTVDPSGSLAGTVNETEEGMRDCNRDDRPPAFGADGSVEMNGDLYNFIEGDFEPQGAVRRTSDFHFLFAEGGVSTSCAASSSTDGDPNDNCVVVRKDRAYVEVQGNKVIQTANPAPANTPDGAGVGLVRTQTGSPYWWGQVAYLASRNPLVNIDTFQPRAPQYATFYANVDASGLGVLAPMGIGAEGRYGSDHCNADGSAKAGGTWVCNGALWWPSSDLTWPHSVRSTWQVTAGQSYNLLDIDCYDVSSRHNPSVTGLLTGQSCTR